MRKLTHSAADANSEKRRLSRLVPVLATAVAVGMAVTLGAPTKSDAEQPRQVCSASVETGRMESFTSATKTSRLFRTPLLESNKFLQISMPNAFVDQLRQAATARPEGERQRYMANAVQMQVPAALTALGTNRSAAFTCVTPPSSAAPAPAAPQPAASTAPPAPQPAPAQDAGAPADAPAARRRVIQPGEPAGPSRKAAPAPKK